MRANLSGAILRATHLQGTYLTDVRFDVATNLADAALDGETRLADIVWNDVPLTRVTWDRVDTLGEESEAWRPRDGSGHAKNDQVRLSEFRAAGRANRQLAVALRAQGLSDDADRFAYRSQLCQRQVLRRQGIEKWPAYLGSLLLWLIAGYGYRPVRSFLTYLVVILAFAASYFLIGHAEHLGISLGGAVVTSMVSFHGEASFHRRSTSMTCS